MSRTRRSTLAAVLVIAPLSSACSMFFMTRPPKAEGPVERGHCTRSAAAPIIDGVLALNALALAAGVYGPSRDDFDSDETFDNYRWGSGIHAGGLAVSAVHGFKWSGECRRRTTQSEQAIRDHLRVLAAQQSGDGREHP
ncbi:hypothetical protein [Candidatus Palauibacter sp.]|uniref:hypothetical protein n=1 Tax=Candidatus Palauibacter sp. TaxID=3101350 RepID=UPI003AF28F7E